MNKIKISPKGFTLIELLVVVLIIGVLTAVALPGYRKSMERSRVADALTTMGAVAKSEHAWYLEHSNYTDDFANLDIELTGTINEGALETDFYTYQLLDTGILAKRNNGEYILYKDYDSQQILCTPGTHYICDDLGAFTKVPCEKVGMAWSNKNSTCYIDPETRCQALNPGVNDIWHKEENPDNNWCGYTNTQNQEIGEGMICKGSTRKTGCNGSTITAGGICESTGQYSCQGSTITAGGTCKGYNSYSCQGAVIYNGGECVGDSSSLAFAVCAGSTINAGGKCYGDGSAACSSVNINGGICEGSNQSCNGSIVHNKGICAGTCYGATVYDQGVCSGSCQKAVVSSGGDCSGWCKQAEINEGGTCSGTCERAIINSGGNCSGKCNWVTINSGGVCSGECYIITVNDGGICKSSETNYCGHAYATYYDSGCCCGDYCGSKPKCVDKGITCPK